MNRKLKVLIFLLTGLLFGIAHAQEATIGPVPVIDLPKEGATFTDNVTISVGFPWGVDWWGWLSQKYFIGKNPQTIMIAVRQELTWCPPPTPLGAAWTSGCKTVNFGGTQYSADQMRTTGPIVISSNAAGMASLLGIKGGAGKYSLRVRYLYVAEGQQAKFPSPWSAPRSFTISPVGSVARNAPAVTRTNPTLSPSLMKSPLVTPTIEWPREGSVLTSTLGPFNLTIRPAVGASNYCPGGQYQYSTQYAPPTQPRELPRFGAWVVGGSLPCDSAEQTKSFPIIDAAHAFKPGYFKVKVRYAKNSQFGPWSTERSFSIVQGTVGSIPGVGQNGTGSQLPQTSTATRRTVAPIAPQSAPPKRNLTNKEIDNR